MISFDFDYYRATDLKAAYDMMLELEQSSKKGIYYSGGTEIMTAFRKNTIQSDAVIDIKGIKGIQDILVEGNQVTIGACVSLNDAIECLKFSYIKEVFSKIADHTTRNAITIGGNLCGRLPYKEVLLPLLALEATIVLYSDNTMKEVPIQSIFDKRLKLHRNDLLFQIKFRNDMDGYFTSRITESTETDYPIIHLFAAIRQNMLFVGLSGYGAYPMYAYFDSSETDLIYEHFESKAKEDLRSTKVYRRHLLKEILLEMKEVLYG